MMNDLVRRSWICLPGLALALAAPSRAQTLTPPAAFGPQVEGTTSAPAAATLQNGQSTVLTISKIAVTGDFAVVTGGTCPASGKVGKGASCTILITFTPKAAGPLSGTLTVTDTSGKLTANVTGTGIAPVAFSPTSLAFGSVPIDETSMMTVTVTNNQSTALNFTSILPNNNSYTVTGNTCGSGIGASPATCQVSVTFSPTVTGSSPGKLTFTDSAGTQNVALSGTGGAAALLSIAVTPSTAGVYVGGTQQFTATGTYSNNTTKNITSTVTWSATPPGIASIASGGLATGAAAGTSTIAAALGSISSSGSSSATLTVVQLFSLTHSLNTARYYHSATLLNTGNVLVAGGIGPVPGESGALGELASAELYSPETGTFTPTNNLNTARDEQSATLLNNGWVLIAGGSGGDNELASAEIYNPTTTSFNPTGNLNTARYEHTATALPSGGVLIAGGYGGGSVLASAELYNPATGKFKSTSISLNAARYSATATLLQNGQVLIAGGADENGPLSTAELFDPATGSFLYTNGMLNVARSGATATLLNGGNVLIAGGYNYTTTGPLTSAEIYTPATETFALTGSETATSWLGTATLLNNSAVLTAGSVLNSAAPQIYNPVAGTFAATSDLNTPRDLNTATLLTNGDVLVAGGHSNASNTVLAAAELFVPPTLTTPNLVSIAITPSSPLMALGASQQFVATGTFGDNSTQQLASVTWSSASPTVATVTNDVTNSGVVFAITAGTANVEACAGAICGTVQVTVSNE